MTPAQLAAIRASIEADAATEAANWPLSRERTRAYLALARAVADGLASEIVAYQEAAAAAQLVIDEPDDDEIPAKLARDVAEAHIGDGDDAIMAALAALAPAPEVPDV